MTGPQFRQERGYCAYFQGRNCSAVGLTPFVGVERLSERDTASRDGIFGWRRECCSSSLSFVTRDETPFLPHPICKGPPLTHHHQSHRERLAQALLLYCTRPECQYIYQRVLSQQVTYSTREPCPQTASRSSGCCQSYRNRGHRQAAGVTTA